MVIFQHLALLYLAGISLLAESLAVHPFERCREE